MTCNTNLFLYSIIIVFVVCLSPNIGCTVPVACRECDRLLFTCSFCISLYRLWESNVCNAFFFLFLVFVCVCMWMMMMNIPVTEMSSVQTVVQCLCIVIHVIFHLT